MLCICMFFNYFLYVIYIIFQMNDVLVLLFKGFFVLIYKLYCYSWNVTILLIPGSAAWSYCCIWVVLRWCRWHALPRQGEDQQEVWLQPFGGDCIPHHSLSGMPNHADPSVILCPRCLILCQFVCVCNCNLILKKKMVLYWLKLENKDANNTKTETIQSYMLLF